MEGVIFWLTPVALLLVLIFLVLYQLERRRPLYFVEPLGTVINGWHQARFDGNEPRANTLISWLNQPSGDQGYLSALLNEVSQPGPSQPMTAQLISLRVIGPLAWQGLLVNNGHGHSVLFGLVEPLRMFIADDHPASLKPPTLEQQAKAAQGGFLTLVLAETALHPFRLARRNCPAVPRHRLVGTLILEPKFDDQALQKLRGLPAEQVRLFSRAPTNFVDSIYERVYGRRPALSIDSNQLRALTPTFAEAELNRAVVLGESDPFTSHNFIRTLERQHSCVAWSVLDEDRALPASIRTRF